MMRKKVSSCQLAVGSSRSSRVTDGLLPTANCQLPTGSRGFTLLELLITLTILTILTLGVVPLVKLSVRRQREQRLRDTLREMRLAIQEFHRDTIGSPCSGAPTSTTATNVSAIPQTAGDPRNQAGGQPAADPRSRVVITDCKIFTVDNPDRYPPDLETLVNGVNIAPRGGGGGNLIRETATSGPKATDIGSEASSTKKKVYLRQLPVDPITGEADWDFRSSYDVPDSTSWGKENVFDVRSKASGTALNGEKYSDW
ncbi:MAG: prepilin-type N-terminal cleavage/methylation domain-containing protein [Pyrinomonadaceae bacterium]|nr:prepilin-type N-terminal cleavage/methylation domain-containing protein [Pyrinomonadaceae bacterium]